MGAKLSIVTFSIVIFFTHYTIAQPRDTLYKVVGTHTFRVPRGYTATINVTCWAGGGGGGTGTNTLLARGGGGAGGISRGVLISAPAGVYTLVVGAGGAPGVNGTESSFEHLVKAEGGFSPVNSNFGGLGGRVSQGAGFYLYKGGDGGNPACLATTGCGGGGGGGGGEFDASGTNADIIQAASGVNGGLGGTNLLPFNAGRGGQGGNDGDPGGTGTNYPNVAPNPLISFGAGGGGKGSGTTSPSGSGTSGAVWIDVQSFLPITLADFSVQYKNFIAQLEWSTFTENHFDQFIIQRSYDGKSFFDAGSVKGKGTSHSEVRYSFTDALPRRGTRVYYRLKQLDTDGSFSYSVIKSVLTTSTNEIYIFPTIVTSDMLVSVVDMDEGHSEYEARIYSSDGKLILTQKLVEKNTSLHLNHLQGGSYVLNIFSNNELKTMRFIKQ